MKDESISPHHYPSAQRATSPINQIDAPRQISYPPAGIEPERERERKRERERDRLYSFSRFFYCGHVFLERY